MKRLFSMFVSLCMVLVMAPTFCNAEKGEPRLLKTITVGEWYEEYDGTKSITEYNYNDSGQLVQTLSYHFLNGMKETDSDIRYEYHKNGELKTVHEEAYPLGIYESHYDRFGHRMEGIHFVITGWVNGLSADPDGFLSAKYDGDDLISVVSNGETYYYEYDEKGRISSVTSTSENWLDLSFSYSKNGNYSIYGGRKGESTYTEEEYTSDGKILHYLCIVREDDEERVSTDLEWTYDEEGNTVRWYGLWWGDTPQDWAVNKHEYQYRADGKLKIEKIDDNIRTYYYDDEGETEEQKSFTPGSVYASEYSGSMSGYSKIYFSDAVATSALQEDDLQFIADYAINKGIYYPWVEGVEGDGIGQSITMEFKKTETFRILGFQIGYAATHDQFEKNNRPKTVHISFDDGSGFDYTFRDVREEQLLLLSEPVTSKSVKIEILDVYLGDECDDTCIYLVRAFR